MGEREKKEKKKTEENEDEEGETVNPKPIIHRRVDSLERLGIPSEFPSGSFTRAGSPLRGIFGIIARISSVLRKGDTRPTRRVSKSNFRSNSL